MFDKIINRFETAGRITKTEGKSIKLPRLKQRRKKSEKTWKKASNIVE